MKQKVIVGMSGGVDSSVAALLLQERGFDVAGVTMRHFDTMQESTQDARSVAKQLGIPWQEVDFRKEFAAEVIHNFTQEYAAGRTPNPCVVCNQKIKWEALLSYARFCGADYIATGHYARILPLANGRLTVAAAVAGKDQTYALYRLTQEQLAATLMPVGEFPKNEVRALAVGAGLPVAHKRDSQEICFIPDHDYAGFIRRTADGPTLADACRPGNFVTREGEVLGRHRGIIHYTVGQRKGLGLAMGRPVFVVEIRPQSREVVIGEQEDLYTRSLYCKNLCFMACEGLSGERALIGKIRYGHAGEACRIRMDGPDRLACEFEEPVRAVTPGQSAVFYEGDHIFCGGVICG